MQISMTTPLRNLILFLCALSAEGAFPIGRIGNNYFGDPIAGYSAVIPQDFQQGLLSYANGSALLLSLPGSSSSDEGGAEMSQAAMTAEPFLLHFPALKGATRQQIVEFLTKTLGLTVQNVRTDNCALTLFAETSYGFIGISTWSGGVGYVLTVQKTSSGAGKYGIWQALSATEIQGPCNP